ncbi:Uncharacterised protein [Mycobacteroides abscessus subsp. massiliense]|nr:Uncharacterised protein [Mycobacteroides abscessus subsp. massiliense]
MHLLVGRFQHRPAHVVHDGRVGLQHRGDRGVPGGNKLARILFGVDRPQRLDKVVHHQLIDGLAQPGLGLEMVLHQPQRHSCFGGDRAQGNSLLAVLGVQVQCGVADTRLRGQVLIGSARVCHENHRTAPLYK